MLLAGAGGLRLPLALSLLLCKVQQMDSTWTTDQQQHWLHTTRKAGIFFLYDVSWNHILKIVEMLRLKLGGTSNYIDLFIIGVITTGWELQLQLGQQSSYNKSNKLVTVLKNLLTTRIIIQLVLTREKINFYYDSLNQ
jgi:hypothetical protein